MNDKINKFGDKIDNFFKPRVGKNAFFAFYLVFFIILGILLINNNKPTVNDQDGKLLYSTSNIENKDYKLQVLVMQNGSIKDMNLDKDLNIEYEYKELLNIYNLKKIFKNSKIESRDKTNDVLNKIHYEVTSNILNSILNKEVNDTVNKLTMHLDPNKEVYLLEFDLSNYMKSLNGDTNYTLKMEYKFVEE